MSGALRVLRPLLRLAAAAALMAAAIWLVGPERLRQQWQAVDRTWFVLAVLLGALAQAVSVLRWETIARIFGLQVRTRALALAYAQGMTLNVLLPGATLGGDALRSLRLQRLGNPLGLAALTVLLDRLSGLWVLCVLSLATGVALLVILGGPAPVALPVAVPGLTPATLAAAYLCGLALLCAIPWLPLHVRPVSAGPASSWPARAWERLAGLHELAVAQRRPLLRSLWSSVLVQVLCALTLWLCVLAAGGKAGYWQVQAVAAPVFVAGALPISYGGFGARELAALAAFPLVGLPGDLGLAASILYGIVAIVLGLVAAPSFAVPSPGMAGGGNRP